MMESPSIRPSIDHLGSQFLFSKLADASPLNFIFVVVCAASNESRGRWRLPSPASSHPLQNYLQKNYAILRLVHVVICRTPYHGCVATYSTGLWVHGKGMASLKYNQYTGVLSIQSLGTQAVGPDLVRTAKYHAILRLVCMLLHE